MSDRTSIESAAEIHWICPGCSTHNKVVEGQWTCKSCQETFLSDNFKLVPENLLYYWKDGFIEVGMIARKGQSFEECERQMWQCPELKCNAQNNTPIDVNGAYECEKCGETYQSWRVEPSELWSLGGSRELVRNNTEMSRFSQDSATNEQRRQWSRHNEGPEEGCQCCCVS